MQDGLSSSPMSPIKIEAVNGSSTVFDADCVSSVEVITRKKWWLFGRPVHLVRVAMRNRPLENIVVTMGTSEAADRLRDRIEQAMLS